MSAIAAVIAAAAARVGAGMIKSVIEKKFGAGAGQIAGDLAGSVIDTVARKAGVEPIDLPGLAERAPDIVDAAVAETETAMPELIALYEKGLEGQFALLQAEQAQGGLQVFWRYGWMYLLAVFWIWRILILPIINHQIDIPIESVDFAVLLTLTSWFMALYMGGHTVKELGKSAIEAMRTRKGA
ncbi:hypothetical protein K1W69_17400 [Hoeflea sp. WL0058]|uniref:Holin of 3TMs, for gene-transfer release n=1 Tax=Flavimaribacter sediminis TaxID=2865987 RepID=A0AAE3D2M3_9HYPH|nr:hypothetical protein [Flavimaribacter sediminis]MBW8638976.1 hypothetical protein [Flavimaribacter sediminis]